MVFSNDMKRNKKGIQSISVLFLFLAIILIATVISGLMLQNAQEFANDGMKGLKKIQNTFKSFIVTQIVGTGSSDGTIDYLEIDAKLLTQDSQIHLDQLTVSVGEPTHRTLLTYRDANSIENSNQGYNTWAEEEFGRLNVATQTISWDSETINQNTPFNLSLAVDFDEDGINDSVIVCDGDGPCAAGHDGTHLAIITSSDGVYNYVPLLDENGNLYDITSIPVTLDVIKAPIDNGLGYVTIQGTTNTFGYELGRGSETVIFYKAEATFDTDLDDDAIDDHIGLNETHLIVFASDNLREDLSYSLGRDLGTPGAINIEHLVQTSDGTRFGTLSVSGTTTITDAIDEEVDINYTPYHLGAGHYQVEYLKRGPQPMDGFITGGDIVRIYAEAYEPFGVHEIIDIQFFYKDMEAVRKQAYVGDTIPGVDRYVIYPKP